ncbi:MAG TPA: biopolymer transporter ExbD [Acidobacteriota bacterium]|nr:biopolymer transporter ExbD [Acidobacteriota bacterium]
MAMQTQSTQTRPSMSEINVTPLVDVMLVLLIIFMVTAPILQTGIEVNLPETRQTEAQNPEQQAVVTISRDERLFYRSNQVNFYELPELLQGDLQDPEEAVFLQADEDVRWKTIVAVVDQIREAGFVHVNLVTKPLQQSEEQQ